MSKFNFARFHLHTSKDLSDKNAFILKGLSIEGKKEDRGHLYSFSNIKQQNENGVTFIFGQLLKYDPHSDEETYDESKSVIINTQIKNRVLGKASFIINSDSSIIAFSPAPNIITQERFIKTFRDLFKENHENMFTDISLSLIKEQYTFIEKVRTLKTIKRIKITLYPSNPNNRDRWKDIDERLQKNDITKYTETLENNKDESGIIIDDETENKFLMSEDGYGDCMAVGSDENDGEKKITTKEKNRTITFDVDNAESLSLLIEIFRSKIKQITERMK